VPLHHTPRQRYSLQHSPPFTFPTPLHCLPFVTRCSTDSMQRSTPFVTVLLILRIPHLLRFCTPDLPVTVDVPCTVPPTYHLRMPTFTGLVYVLVTGLVYRRIFCRTTGLLVPAGCGSYRYRTRFTHTRDSALHTTDSLRLDTPGFA